MGVPLAWRRGIWTSIPIPETVVLSQKPRIAVANKIDALDEPERLKKLTKHLKKLKVPLYPISAVTGEGLNELKYAIAGRIEEIRQSNAESLTDPTKYSADDERRTTNDQS